MKNLAILFLLLQCFATAQNPPAAPQLLSSRVGFPVYGINAVPITGAVIQVVGNPGRQTIYYWAVANYPAGSVISAIGSVTNAPNTLTSGNYVAIYPNYPATTGVTVDILKTATPAMPIGACNCAVETGVSSGPINDQSNSTGAYTVTLTDPNTLRLWLTNEVISTNTAHLLLRTDSGTLVCDLSIACQSTINFITGTGTADTLAMFTAPNVIGNSPLSTDGSTRVTDTQSLTVNGTAGNTLNGGNTLTGGNTLNGGNNLNGGNTLAGTTTLNALAGGGTQCTHVSNTGVITGTGADCSNLSGTGTTNTIPLWSGPNALGNSPLSTDGSTRVTDNQSLTVNGTAGNTLNGGNTLAGPTTLSALAGGGSQCLHVSNTGVVSGTGADCPVGTAVDLYTTISPGCTASGSSNCTVSGTWPSGGFADTSYFVNCTPTSFVSSGSAFWVSAKTTTTFSVTITVLGFNNPGGFNSFDCHGHHN